MISSTVFVCEEKIMSTTTSRNNSPIRLNKVPQIVLTFWIIKILSTTVGETVADYLAVNLGLGLGKTCAFMLAVEFTRNCGRKKTRSVARNHNIGGEEEFITTYYYLHN